eukprot:2475858-Rhodomonas_salina.1
MQKAQRGDGAAAYGGPGPQGRCCAMSGTDLASCYQGESDSEEEQDHVTSKQVGSQGGRLAAMQQAQRDMGGNKMVEDRPAGSVGGGFRNKQRVLIIASRGITHRFRHLMLDIGKLLPHGTKDAKMESKDRPS